MGGNIRFSSEEFQLCIQKLLKVSDRFSDYQEEYAALFRQDMGDMPKELTRVFLTVRNTLSEIVEMLEADTEKMRKIADVYAFYEKKNLDLVESLPVKTEAETSSGRSISPHAVEIMQWNGSIRSRRLFRENVLMDDWLYAYVANRSL